MGSLMKYCFQIIKAKKFRSKTYHLGCFCYVKLSLLFFAPPTVTSLVLICEWGVVHGPWVLYTLVLSLLKWPFSVRFLMLFQYCSTPSSPPCTTADVNMSESRSFWDVHRNKQQLEAQPWPKGNNPLQECGCEEHTNLGHLSLMKFVRLLVFQMWELLCLFSS